MGRRGHVEGMQDLRKGSTALLVLHVLADEPMYGFQLVEALRARTGGVLDFAEGMLYPMLHKLERAAVRAFGPAWRIGLCERGLLDHPLLAALDRVAVVLGARLCRLRRLRVARIIRRGRRPRPRPRQY